MSKKWGSIIFGGSLFLIGTTFLSMPILADENIEPIQPEKVVVEEELSSTVSSQEDSISDESMGENPEIAAKTDKAVAIDTTSEEASSAEVKEQKAKRTILLYDCGSNLETDAGMASYNLRQILASIFSEDEDIRFIVMTGGSEKWWLESDYLSDPYGKGISVNDEGEYIISAEYNQIWEAKGVDNVQNPGKLVLLDADGITGDGESALKSEDELMVTADTLKGFINYAVENFPAEKYGLIMWDHGMGPSGGFGGDEHDGFGGQASLSAADLIQILSDNAVTNDGN